MFIININCWSPYITSSRYNIINNHFYNLQLIDEALTIKIIVQCLIKIIFMLKLILIEEVNPLFSRF